jgi:hypothetical protein
MILGVPGCKIVCLHEVVHQKNSEALISPDRVGNHVAVI